MRWKEETAAYRWRLCFRGRRGFDAEVGNDLGRPATSALSAACLLRFFLSGLRCASAQPLQHSPHRPLPPRLPSFLLVIVWGSVLFG